MTQTRSPAHRRHRSRLPTPLALALLAVAFAAALLTPLPVAPNQARAEVVASVAGRLPGWHIAKARSSWEGAWSVVATCGTLHLGFQLVPGHGLAPGDAWLHPEDGYARERLGTISDSWRALVWFAEPIGLRTKTLSCRQEMARVGGGARPSLFVPGAID
ncbi:MAG TPA: hypothetical protein VFY43_01880 [Candidatus Limnocylindria bacterium]|nr:hypothetical protein [Candidatus Limnocylindria bacterium]